MRIALDYDQTYTADPEMWDAAIEVFRVSGHEAVLLTYRDDRFDWTDLMTHLQDVMKVPVYCTRGVGKAWWSLHFGPGKIDIWIDDNVKSITDNSSFDPEGLAKWREEDSGGPRPAV